MLCARHAIALCTLALLLLGVVMVASASMTIGGDPVTLDRVLLSRQTVYAGLALLALAAAGTAPARGLVERLLRRPEKPVLVWGMLAALVGVCAIVYLPGIGMTVNGARRWLGVPVPGLGSLSVQPSEVAKWGAVLVVVRYALLRGPEMSRFWTGLLPPLIGLGLLGAVIALEDLGTGALICGAGAVVLIAAGGRLWQLGAVAPLGLAAVGVAVLAEPYRVHRLTSFLDPFATPETTGYHMIQSMVAVASGGVFGRGLGFGLQKFGYLPEDHTDFLFAVICEELGLAGATLVLALYAGLLLSVLRVARKREDVAGRLLCLGVATTIGFQALINLFAVTGLGPTKGIALPLLSAGGTGWVLTALTLGVVGGLEKSAETGGAADEAGEANEEAESEAGEPDGDPPVVVTRPVEPTRLSA